MKYVINIIKLLISLLPGKFLVKLVPNNLIALYYHLVENENSDYVSKIGTYKTIHEFEKDIETLLKYFKPISAEDLSHYVQSGQRIPEKSLLITIDDGLRGSYENMAPILYKKGIPAIFFICSGFVDNIDMFYRHKASMISNYIINNKLEKDAISAINKLNINKIFSGDIDAYLMKIKYHNRENLNIIANYLSINISNYLREKKPYMNRLEVRQLVSMGFDIGAHSVSHPPYHEISLECQIDQTITSLKFVENEFNTKLRLFSFPFSDASISREFFNRLKSEDYNVDLFFGTSGFGVQPNKKMIQRLYIERQGEHVFKIMRNQYINYFKKRVRHRLY